jgi:hypothetical protein
MAKRSFDAWRDVIAPMLAERFPRQERRAQERPRRREQVKWTGKLPWDALKEPEAKAQAKPVDPKALQRDADYKRGAVSPVG